MSKTTKARSSRQPGESLVDYVSRLCRRYGRSRIPTLRRAARQWRVVIRRYRQRAIGGNA